MHKWYEAIIHHYIVKYRICFGSSEPNLKHLNSYCFRSTSDTIELTEGGVEVDGGCVSDRRNKQRNFCNDSTFFNTKNYFLGIAVLNCSIKISTGRICAVLSPTLLYGSHNFRRGGKAKHSLYL